MTTNTDIKNYFNRAENILTEIDTLQEDYKELMAEAKSNGLDVKALKLALKEKRNPIAADLKQKVNYYLEASGQFTLFAAA